MLRASTRRLFVRVSHPEGSSTSNVVCGSIRRARFAHQVTVALIAICGFAAGVSAQTTVTLSTPGTHITTDLTIRGGDYGMSDYSDSDTLVSKTGSEDVTRRIFLKFDTEKYIPANAVIQSARLQMVLKTADDSVSRPLTAYHVTKSFVKEETNWYYFRYGQAWTTRGGDFGSSFGTTYVNNRVGATYTFDLTKLVQRSVNGDFGSRYTRVALLDTGGSHNGSYRAFHSTRAASAAYRPRLVITYGASTTSPAPAPPSTTTTGATLRVMQWNIQNTKGSDGRCDPNRIANTIVAQNPHVVSLNEVKSYSGACSWNFDMSAKLESLLQQKTGVAWYRKYVDIGSKAGNALLSRLPLVSSSSRLLSYGRGVAQIGVVVNGRTVNLFSTHVEYYTSSWRPIQIREAVSWMKNFSEPRIIMGDFNTWPGTSDYSLIATPYQDAWVAAQKLGTATAYNGTGATHGASRFDYVFFSRVAALSLKSVKVPDARVNGVSPSDHAPVVAVFGVN
jgi:endonuclease/exonuclease/phosphatase family metal-dependent hydrolase